jgi:hypothetical protein
VQKAIKEKKECFRHMHLDRSANNVERYKVAKKTAKRAVSEVSGPNGIPIEVWRSLEDVAIV